MKDNLKTFEVKYSETSYYYANVLARSEEEANHISNSVLEMEGPDAFFHESESLEFVSCHDPKEYGYEYGDYPRINNASYER